MTASTRARDFFEGTLPAALQSAPEQLAVPYTYVIDVSGEGGGAWTLAGKGASSCTAGAAAGADCTVRLSDDAFEALLAGEKTLDDLFFERRVDVDGDVDAAAALAQLFTELLSPLRGFDLATFVAPLSREEFLTRHWPDKPLVLHGALERLTGFDALAELRDVHALLDAWRGTIRVMPPGAEDYLSPHVSVDTAARLYQIGFTLMFSSVHLQVRPLARALETLRTDLGLPVNVWGRCMVYANPKDVGLNPHFDENANFVIQLRGEKVWRIAPNSSVENPTVSHLIGGPVSPELAPQIKGALPDRMPEDAETITLYPGSILYLPRAYWHATCAGQEAMSLNFTFSQPTWADVFTQGLRRWLIERPEWRALAIGAGALDATRAEGARAHLGAMVARLCEELATARPDAGAFIERLAPTWPPDIDVLDLQRDWFSALGHLGLDKNR